MEARTIIGKISSPINSNLLRSIRFSLANIHFFSCITPPRSWKMHPTKTAALLFIVISLSYRARAEAGWQTQRPDKCRFSASKTVDFALFFLLLARDVAQKFSSSHLISRANFICVDGHVKRQVLKITCPSTASTCFVSATHSWHSDEEEKTFLAKRGKARNFIFRGKYSHSRKTYFSTFTDSRSAIQYFVALVLDTRLAYLHKKNLRARQRQIFSLLREARKVKI